MTESQPEPLFLGPETSESRAVVLPCEPDQFRDFIAGLLGRPQTIERSIAGPFEVSKSDIENIYHLIDQRLMSQNEATLIQFTARIVYDDNSSVLLNSFFDFNSYSEVKPLKSRSAHLGWTFLVKFRNKKYPEKQQIDISFYGGFVSNTYAEFEVRFGHVPNRAATRGGTIQYRISHTDRTWGTDMDALLDGQLRTLVKTEPRTREALREHSGKIGFLSWLILFSGSLISSVIVTSKLIGHHMIDLTNFSLKEPITIEQLAREINVVIQFLIADPTSHYIIYAIIFNVIALIGTIALAVSIGELASGTQRSFVLLTAKAIEEKSLWSRSPKNSIFRFFISVVGALVISVIGNTLFYLALKYWTE
jgi:hypothetical protein